VFSLFCYSFFLHICVFICFVVVVICYGVCAFCVSLRLQNQKQPHAAQRNTSLPLAFDEAALDEAAFFDLAAALAAGLQANQHSIMNENMWIYETLATRCCLNLASLRVLGNLAPPLIFGQALPKTPPKYFVKCPGANSPRERSSCCCGY
jgi:hypothetical protein